jgi:Putative adhesin
MPEFETPEPISVVLELTVGDVSVIAGERTDTVVEVRPSDSARRLDVTAAEQTRVEYADGRLAVKTAHRWKSYSPFSDGGAVDVVVSLPAGSRVSGKAGLGTFRLTGGLGDCQIKTGLGDIHVEQVGAVELTTGLGEVSVQRATGDAELSTGSGQVQVGAVDGAAVIKNSNGDTRIGQVSGELRVKSANGDIAIEQPHASLTAKTANGDIHIGNVERGSVVAETGFGAVEIAIPDGIAAWLDLNTRFGRLHNALDAAEPPNPDGDRVEVRAHTAFGDITIRRSHPLTSVDSAA